MTLTALMTLTACDYQARQDFKNERSSGTYQSAMADYNAGRMKQAIEGFKKVCMQEPANASARFQLACLLQEEGKDMLGAVCAVREFQDQQPKSDRAKLARDRMLICEKQLARDLAEKHSLSANAAAYARETEEVRKALKAAEARNVKLQDDLAQAMRRVAALDQENVRLKDAMKEDSAGNEAAGRRDLKDAKALLDDGEETDRIKLSSDIASLKAEEKVEQAISSSLLPAQEKGAKEKRDADAAARESKKVAEREARTLLHEKRPEFYVVQDGDTLYKIATRFYGTYTAWRRIREANKALISVDGRVKTGDKLRLPE